MTCAVYRSPIIAMLALLLAAFFSYGFLGFAENHAAIGNELYDEGKYDEAVGKYGEALLDDPDSPILNFNMGDAHYKAGNYEEALASFRRVRLTEDSKREARVAYNLAAVEYRKAASLEAESPQEALKGYAEALVIYRRVLGIDPTDTDAKFNYELVSQRLEDLKKKLEEEKDKQEEQQDQQPEDQQQEQQEDQKPCDNPQPGDEQQQQEANERQEKEQQQNEPQQSDQEPQQQAQEEQPRPEEQQQAQEQPSDDPSQAQQTAATEGEAGEEMSPREASALVDAARNDELRPEDFIRRQQGGALAQPSQDW